MKILRGAEAKLFYYSFIGRLLKENDDKEVAGYFTKDGQILAFKADKNSIHSVEFFKIYEGQIAEKWCMS